MQKVSLPKRFLLPAFLFNILFLFTGVVRAETPSCPDPRISPTDEKLIAAATSRDLPDLLSMLNQGANPNLRDAQCHTAVLWAARAGYAVAFLELVERGGDIHIALPEPDGRDAVAFLVRLGMQDIVDKALTARSNFLKRQFVQFARSGEHLKSVELIENGFLKSDEQLTADGTTPLTVLAETYEQAEGADRAAILRVDAPNDQKGWTTVLTSALEIGDQDLLGKAASHAPHREVATALKRSLTAGRVELVRHMIDTSGIVLEDQHGNASALIVELAAGIEESDATGRALIDEIFEELDAPRWPVWAEVSVVLKDSSRLHQAVKELCRSVRNCRNLRPALNRLWTIGLDDQAQYAGMILGKARYRPDSADIRRMLKHLDGDAAAVMLEQMLSASKGGPPLDLHRVLDETIALLVVDATKMERVADILIRRSKVPVTIDILDKLTQTASYSPGIIDILETIVETKAWRREQCSRRYSSRSLAIADRCASNGDRFAVDCRPEWPGLFISKLLGDEGATERSAMNAKILVGLSKICGGTIVGRLDFAIALLSELEQSGRTAAMLFDQLKLAGFTIPWSEAGGVCMHIFESISQSDSKVNIDVELKNLISLLEVTPSARSLVDIDIGPDTCGNLIGRGFPGTWQTRTKYLEALGKAGFDLSRVAQEELRRLVRRGGHVGTALVALRFANSVRVGSSRDFHKYVHFTADQLNDPRAEVLDGLLAEMPANRAGRWAIAIRTVAQTNKVALPRDLRDTVQMLAQTVQTYPACDAEALMNSLVPTRGLDCSWSGTCDFARKLYPLLTTIEPVTDAPNQRACMSRLLTKYLRAIPDEPEYELTVIALLAAGATVGPDAIGVVTENEALIQGNSGPRIMQFLLDSAAVGTVDNLLLEKSGSICHPDSTIQKVVEAYLGDRSSACSDQ